MLRTGDVVFIKNVSVKSMEFYKVHSTRHSYLICPCRVPKNQSLVIAGTLTQNTVMLHYYGDKSKMTIVYIDDLVKAVVK